MSQVLRIGLERVPITPPIGIMLTGYAVRTKGSEYLLDDLYATALVLDNGETKIALVTCDLIFLHPKSVARIRREVAQCTDIPAAQIMICCSHTHSGPIIYPGPQQTARDHAYTTNLIHQIAGAICAADAQLQPGRIGYGRGQASIGVNRREQRPDGQVVLGENLAGPVDPQVTILRLDSTEGYPLAVVANYACHAVALSYDSYGISADWPGAMRWAVESATGATCLFVQGAGADINPCGGPKKDYDHVQKLGQSVAGSVLQAWADIEAMQEAIPLSAASRNLDLPLWGPMGPDGKPITPAEEIAASSMKMTWQAVVELRERLFPWEAEVKEIGGAWYTPIELQAFRMGQAALVAIPAEPFVEVGLAIKGRSPLRYTMIAGYSNGSVGYLPTAAAYEFGGYEVNNAYFWYRLPAPLAPTCAQQIEDAAVAMLGEL